MNEEWKDITGYENEYQISNLGRIKSLKNNIIMKQSLNKKYNRYSIMLWKNGISKRFWVARLVAQEFIPNPDPNKFTQVNHKDEDKTNNNSNNLEWCTVSYNNTYGTRVKRQKEKVSKRVIAYDLNGEFINTFNSIKEAANALNCHETAISAVCHGRHKHTNNYIFKFL